ncbi:leucyl-tRNA synthetase [Tenacibaculum mesophilum]|uniref:Leucine--tRNA ligase n=1 Tax=Tenacibaculum mesophilum TaxID=104268 RepID=A0ABM7CHC8_9FLAO|nr:class I tRNA ligase family protein [Tenacibaculum mesophilum]AZJ33221.1 leucine--tRNA ligase [Tenacibaculum mesophilum]QFS28467.1 leucine--tRNA ligase [Tenacibaculum mesophilum]SHF65039.1 leucyl-tRNA synthetase [Tenacibaculum mesophilum]
MQYNHQEIEKKWQKYWANQGTFKAENNSDKPKYYVLDMFPYPSGAGLHVGHPLGYIASDIYARYKRHKGFNVLHPQGYDSFGLPAEQYAIQTGQHPAITTETNIKTYRRQLDNIGFSFDWSREVRTSNPEYYKWTQWIFIQLFNSWYNKDTDKAEGIATLVAKFEAEGNANVNAVSDEDIAVFSAEEWKNFSDTKQQEILLQYRLTFLSDTEVNWCPALGTVLANDEIVNGVSERGGHPVVRKKMTQWSMRISAYAQRLLDGLQNIDWPQPLKDSQTNWIGRSQGAMVAFDVDGHDAKIDVFTTRPDTIFGVSFMTLAPEHDLVAKITTAEQKEAVEAYVEATAKRSERDRMADVKTISGVFTGAYALHPFTGKQVPIWIGDYVLASYGTGAVMAVPCGDQRDYDFAKHFGLEIPNIFADVDISEKANDAKDGIKLANSDFLDGLNYKKGMKTVIYELEKRGFGYGKINYRLRDAVFSRQRYWGEPFPVYYKDGMPQMIEAKHLPIVLPEVEKYLPTEDGKPPLGNAEVWAWNSIENRVVSNELIDNETVFPLELNTMPGWAGSSWYFNRYMDSNNEGEFVSKEAVDYWKQIDLYIGGSEHATGHLLYARFWQKFLFDRGLLPVDEFAKKLINQGMILGTSAFADILSINIKQVGAHDKTHFLKTAVFQFVITNELKDSILQSNFDSELLYDVLEKVEGFKRDVLNDENIDIDFELLSHHSIRPTHIDVSIVDSSDLVSKVNLQKWLGENVSCELIEDEYKVYREVEKMSKSKYNVVNPDLICEEYGADSLRLFEMFLGPLEQTKPWKTSGISGVYSFLKKLWKLFTDENGINVSDAEPTKDELKTLHKTIKKVEEDIENFSFNTSVSTFMIAVNELTAQKCNKRQILEPLLVLISPYAPHIAEELWSQLGHNESIATVTFPKFEEKHLVESSKNYPVSFNGKMRFTLELPLDMSKDEIEKTVMAHEKTQQQLQGREPKKVIIVPGKIINIVG